MKVGEIVAYKGKGYRVGVCRTDVSIELVELSCGSRGLWVTLAEVDKVSWTSQEQNRQA